MDIHNLDMIVRGKRYRTVAAMLIAREAWPDEKSGSDSALATTLLFRTSKGSYFRQIQSHSDIIRDQIEPALRDEAMQQYLAMPVKIVPIEEAFPGMAIEDA